MNMFSYYITTHFITSNKGYNSCCNLYSVYQTYPKKPVMAALLLLLLITSQGKSGMTDWLFVWYYYLYCIHNMVTQA